MSCKTSRSVGKNLGLQDRIYIYTHTHIQSGGCCGYGATVWNLLTLKLIALMQHGTSILFAASDASYHDEDATGWDFQGVGDCSKKVRIVMVNDGTLGQDNYKRK